MAKALKKQVLGRGLSTILKDSKNKSKLISARKLNSILEIDVSKIDVNPFQPRSTFDKEKLDELITSIKNIGLIQPVTVKNISKNKVSFAALDTFENEPNPSIKILMNQNISLTPHIGAATNEAQKRIGIELADQIINIYNS